jgi:hypothetical protein
MRKRRSKHVSPVVQANTAPMLFCMSGKGTSLTSSFASAALQEDGLQCLLLLKTR